jgi:hypothetical protein
MPLVDGASIALHPRALEEDDSVTARLRSNGSSLSSQIKKKTATNKKNMYYSLRVDVVG